MAIYGFIGLGLIGGSIAKALKAAEPDCRIMAYMRTRAKLEQARSEGTIDVILPGVGKELSACDVIFLCTPVEYASDYLEKLKPVLKEGALVTDVGSTKSEILEKVSEIGMEECFIGGHPMAGSEKSGYEFSDPVLLENIFYLLCPTAKTPPERTRRMEELVREMRAVPCVIDAAAHDRAVATISHLPHLVAASLVNLVKETDDERHTMRTLAAGGFKDITRIASSSPVMWQQIFSSNRKPVLAVLRKYIASLEAIERELEEDDMSAIHDLFVESGSFRSEMSDENGLMNAQYSFSVRVADRPGAISIISAVLSAGAVSIKNIGINHNRESGDGALRIEFYDAESCLKAEHLLKEYNYQITR